MKIILVSAKQGGGKSTLTKYIRDSYAPHYPAENIFSLKFASPLYEMHHQVRSVLIKYGIKVDLTKKDGDLLQLLGTEWGRNRLGDNVWVSCLLNHLRELPPESLVTIDDCRFENEFDAFDLVPNCYRIRLECSREIRKMRAEYWREMENHPSEVGLDHYAATGRFDLVLDSGLLQPTELFQRIQKFIEENPRCPTSRK